MLMDIKDRPLPDVKRAIRKSELNRQADQRNDDLRALSKMTLSSEEKERIEKEISGLTEDEFIFLAAAGFPDPLELNLGLLSLGLRMGYEKGDYGFVITDPDEIKARLEASDKGLQNKGLLQVGNPRWGVIDEPDEDLKLAQAGLADPSLRYVPPKIYSFLNNY